jgi:hypothetical protein
MNARATAVEAYETFHGRPGRKVSAWLLPDQDVEAYRLGKIEAIAYRAWRYGKSMSFIHEFADTAAPYLDVSHDGRQLYLTHGDYGVTDHGIEDHVMPTLLAINPHKPGSKPKYKVLNTMATPKRNSKGQFLPSKKSTTTKAKPRHTNPAPPARHVPAARAPAKAPSSRRTNSPQIIYMEPEKPKRKKKRHSNPYGGRGLGIDLVQLGTAGVAQATGALVTEAFFNWVPIPAQWKTGPAAALVKIAFGIFLAIAIAKFGPKSKQVRDFCQNFAEGTVTIALVNWLMQMFPQLQNGMGYTTASNVLYDMGQVRELGQVRDMDGISYQDGLAYGEMGRATQYQTYG